MTRVTAFDHRLHNAIYIAHRWTLVAGLTALGVALAACGDGPADPEDGAVDAGVEVLDATGSDAGVDGGIPDSAIADSSIADIAIFIDASADGGPAEALELYVDPVSGDDANDGSLSSPLRTLGEALRRTISGWTIRLGAGTYSDASGEDWSVSVPEGVAVTAITPGTAVLSATPDANQTALTFLGGGEARGLVLEGFTTGIRGTLGTVTLAELTITEASTGIRLGGEVIANATDLVIEDGAAGIEISASGSLDMRASVVRGMGPNCGGGIVGILVRDSGELSLDDVLLEDNLGTAIQIRNEAWASVVNSTLRRNGSDGCGRGTTIDTAESGSMRVENSALSDPNRTVGSGSGIMTADGTVEILGGSIRGYLDRAAIEAGGDGAVTISGTTLAGGRMGVFASRGSWTVSGATVRENTHQGMLFYGAAVARVRGTLVTANDTGIFVQEVSSAEDFGTLVDPGLNTLTGNRVALSIQQDAPGAVSAAGNDWTPNSQGADASGHYATATVSTGCGANFCLLGAGASLGF